MNDHDAFLSACQKSPKDIGLRLVFADWLEEHDEILKAEFLRLEAAILTEPQGSSVRTDLETAFIAKYDELIISTGGKTKKRHNRRVPTEELCNWIDSTSLQCWLLLVSDSVPFNSEMLTWLNVTSGFGLMGVKVDSEDCPTVIEYIDTTIDLILVKRALTDSHKSAPQKFTLEVSLIDYAHFVAINTS